MADAPSTSTYVLISSDSNNLPNCRQLGALDGIVIGDTGPGGFALIGPSNFLGSLQDLSTLGFVARTDVDTAAVRTLTSDSSILITNPQGTEADPHFSVIANSTVQNVILAVDGVDQTTQGRLNFIGQGTAGVTVVYNGGLDAADITISGSAAPSDATYIIQTPSDSLSHEQALSLLDTGIMKSTTGTGVVSIAVAGTDFQAPSANLTAIAALSPTQGNLITGTSGGSYTSRVLGAANTVPVSDGTDWAWGVVPETGAPADATYITTSNNGTLTNEFSLGTLEDGLIKISVSAEIATPATAVAGTDYYAPMLPTNAACSLIEDGTKIFLGTSSSQVTALAGSAQLVSMGQGSLALATSANGVTAIGHGAADSRAVYGQCTFIGANTDASASGLLNSTAIGSLAIFAQSDMMLLGNGVRVCINRADPGVLGVSSNQTPFALQLGNDTPAIDPQILMLSSSAPTLATIPSGAGLWYVDTNTPKFATSGGVETLMPNPMSAVGDLVVGGTGGAATRLGAGASGRVLTSNGPSSALTWEVPSSESNVVSYGFFNNTGSGFPLTSGNTAYLNFSVATSNISNLLTSATPVVGAVMIFDFNIGLEIATMPVGSEIFQFAIGSDVVAPNFTSLSGNTSNVVGNTVWSVTGIQVPVLMTDIANVANTTYRLYVKNNTSGSTMTYQFSSLNIMITYLPGGFY